MLIAGKRTWAEPLGALLNWMKPGIALEINKPGDLRFMIFLRFARPDRIENRRATHFQVARRSTIAF
jgi:hypothetical protein